MLFRAVLIAVSLLPCACHDNFSTNSAWWQHLATSPVGQNVTLQALRGMMKDTDINFTPANNDADSDPMKLVLFDAATVEAFGARCLDGTPSGYYYREGVENQKFVIFLQALNYK